MASANGIKLENSIWQKYFFDHGFTIHVAPPEDVLLVGFASNMCHLTLATVVFCLLILYPPDISEIFLEDDIEIDR